VRHRQYEAAIIIVGEGEVHGRGGVPEHIDDDLVLIAIPQLTAIEVGCDLPLLIADLRRFIYGIVGDDGLRHEGIHCDHLQAVAPKVKPYSIDIYVIGAIQIITSTSQHRHDNSLPVVSLPDIILR